MRKGTGVLVLILGIVMCLCSIGKMGYDVMNQKAHESACTATTVGEVYSFTNRSRNIGARFTVDGTTYNAHGRDSFKSYDYGSQVEIKYDPTDPQMNYAGMSPQRMNTIFGVLLIFAGICSIVAGVKTLRR